MDRLQNDLLGGAFKSSHDIVAIRIETLTFQSPAAPKHFACGRRKKCSPVIFLDGKEFRKTPLGVKSQFVSLTPVAQNEIPLHRASGSVTKSWGKR
jgi:hypothetical protein